MGYCDLLIKPDLIRSLKFFTCTLPQMPYGFCNFFSLFYSVIFFFQMICLQVSRILLKYSVNLFNCLSVIWQSKECTHIRLNLIIFILKYFIFCIANLLKVQCFQISENKIYHHDVYTQNTCSINLKFCCYWISYSSDNSVTCCIDASSSLFLRITSLSTRSE